MAAFVSFVFKFEGVYRFFQIPIEDIDIAQYETIWSAWGEFEADIETTSGLQLNVLFDYELTADKDFSIDDTIGINNAYVNIYLKGEDFPIKTINPISIRRYEQE